MTFGLIEVFQLLITSQCLVLCLYLLWRKEAKASTRFSLFGLLLNLGAHMALNLLDDYFAWDPRRILSFLYGPFLYLYVESLVHLKPPFVRNMLLFVGLAFCWGMALSLIDASVEVFAYSIFLFIGTAMIASFRLLFVFRRFQNEHRSDGLQNTLNWLLILLSLFALVFVLDLSQFLFSQFRLESEGLSAGLFGSLLLFVNILVIRGLRFPLVFEGIPEQAWPQDLLGEKPIPEISVEEKVLSQKWFEESDLTLSKLAEYLDLHPKTLSQIINQTYGKNFSEFVNGFRLQAAKQRMLDPDCAKETISEILFAVGFNSKSTFNAYFKSKEGITPTQFRKSQASK